MTHWIEQLGDWARTAQPGDQVRITSGDTGEVYTLTASESVQPERHDDARIYIPHEHVWISEQTLCSRAVTLRCACGATMIAEEDEDR
ncbi:hypothetical protein [Isoptericola sp. NPDC055881]